MYRLSREKKREQKRATRSVAAAATPIDVHVPVPQGAAGAGGSRAGAWASVGGVRVDPAPGQEIQQAVLDHLRRIALATGRPVLATITDERIGYVVPLQVHGDGSSTFTAQPLRTAAPEPSGDAPRPVPTPVDEDTQVLRQFPEPGEPSTRTRPLRRVSAPVPTTEPVPLPGPPAAPAAPGPVADGAPGPVAGGGPGPAVPGASSDAVPGTPPGVAPGVAVAPTGQFGPPPVMDAGPAEAGARSGARAGMVPDDVIDDVTVLDPDPGFTPARGFDAVAEAVLGDDPGAPAGDGAALLAEPLAQVNEAVRAGRIEEAAALAERTVAETSGTLGPAHPEVLRVRELTAYIAYLADDPLRAFGLSLDLARVRLGARDEEGAYGNVCGAATAWRAVRDPEEGLRLGRDLIGLWSELAAGDGPAAEETEELESARARMDRLTARARRQTSPSAD
ncbi:tetratricopeptide repeat protein [Streptomyces sp. NPDC047017]|uniref:tetratricopeptide repeat protein n=1 Tax=Streptomyces sp. NPDC047017 TaxID=3155024 RepID=UPI0033FD4F6A